VPQSRDLQKFVLWGLFGHGNTPHQKKSGGKNRDARHGLCRRPWHSVARSGVSSVLITL
jgi:hypothetical protein